MNFEFEQVHTATDTESTFTASGEALLIVTGNPSDLEFALIAPDDTALVLETFEANGQQRIRVPRNTTLRLSGTAGAKAWIAGIPNSVEGLLL